MKLNRVVVTGYGLTSPIGNTPEEFWNSLKEGKIGIGPITKFDHSDFAVHNAAEVQDFPFDKYFIKKDTNRFDNYSLYSLYAAQEAVTNANLDVEAIDKDRFGVIVASGIGGIKEIEDQVIRLHEKGPKRVKPMTLPKALPNMAAGNVAMRFGANGICKSINTACASSNDAIGDAFRSIKFGFQDVMLVGGSESSITPFAIAGFQALTALSTTEDPTRASIPFDKDRNGFVMGEGSGMLVLESLEHAEKRGATILAEVVGYGNTCDAYHMTSPHPEGQGAIKAMKLALEEAEISPEQVAYVNAHGTSTPANEKGESGAIVAVLGKDVPVSSTKSFTGHLLGAAGAVEAIATIEAMRHSFVPKTAGTSELSDYIEANVVYGQGLEQEIPYAISNTFGFGGHNAVLAFKRWEGQMNINEIKDLMAQFDQSSLREFSYKNQSDELTFSKNEGQAAVATAPAVSAAPIVAPVQPASAPVLEPVPQAAPTAAPEVALEAPTPAAEGDVVESPLVGVAYLAAGPDKPAFVSVGDQVKKGQTLMIIEAMKVMNEVPAPKDGLVTEILVQNEEMVEFGKGLVRIK